MRFFLLYYLGTEIDINTAEINKNITTEKIYRPTREFNTTEWFEGYGQNKTSDLWLFLYFTILLLFVGFIRWICCKICAISTAHEEENDDISEPLIIESNFGEMETELAVIEIESKKLDRSQSAEEINVIQISLSHGINFA